MSLKNLRRIPKRINFRLAFVFSGIFLVSAAVLYSVTFFTLYSSLRAEDHETLRVRMLSYWASYQSGGLERLIREIEFETSFVVERPFLVRIADPRNRTIFQTAPHAWNDFPLGSLGEMEISAIDGFISLASPTHAYKIEVGSVLFSDEYLVQIGTSTRNRDMVLEHFRRNFLSILAILLVGSFLAGAFSAARALKPISALNAAVQNVVETGRISERVAERGTGDDLDETAHAFNLMLDRIERLVKGMKESLDTVAHDLRTPMARFRGVAELALQAPPDLELYREALGDALEESETIVRMLTSIMDISAAESGVMKLRIEEFDLVGLVRDVIELYDYVGEEHGITIKASGEPSIIVRLDASRVRQAVANVIDNAVKYSADRTTIEVSFALFDWFAEIRIVDHGIGIPPQDLPRIWDRLYRGSSAESHPGLGLGLSLVKAIIEAHGGHVSAESTAARTCSTTQDTCDADADADGAEPGSSTTFRLVFPLEAPSSITKL